MMTSQHAGARPVAQYGTGPATVALAAIAYFVSIIGILHVLRADVSPIQQPTSQYAVGEFGVLMTSAFLSMSVATVALLIGLHRGVPWSPRLGVGLALLSVWAVGLLIAMTFPLNAPGTATTRSAVVHRINGPLIFLSLSLGAFLVSRSFAHHQSWRPIARPALLLSRSMLVLYIALLLSVVGEFGFAGLLQRLLLAAVAAWFIVVAMRMRSLAGHSGPQTRISKRPAS